MTTATTATATCSTSSSRASGARWDAATARRSSGPSAEWAMRSSATRAPSLRTTLVAGLVLVNLAVIGGIAAVVYARARREAYASLQADLRLRAETLAGLLELGP